jgi:hypothetical protein
MSGSAHRLFPADLANALDRSFVEGATWPLDRGALAALLDMGLDPRQIARYFSVTPTAVVALLHAVGMDPLRKR